MDDKQKLYQSVKLFIAKWIDENKENIEQKNISISVIRDEETGLVVSFENDEVMAELVVEQPDFAPYRFVSFEVAAIEDGRAKIVYSWYDNDTTTKQEIDNALINGIDFISNS
ncbi:hypothetical protein [Enterococcus sp. AZ192]|uniref:hypothetical protein n=1 Tax=unclassified Enterococcus TaxID=2608891 RepID=UPI003D2B5BA3